MIAVLVIVACLVASFLNAAAAILQRRAAGRPDASELFSREFSRVLFRNRQWLAGMGLQIISAAATGVALYWGSLILVEPLLTTDLIFLMLMLHLRFGVRVGLREYGGALAICLGLNSLLIAAFPHGGREIVDELWWILPTSVVVGMIALGAVIMRRAGSSTLRAGVGGVAAGLNLALTASFVKLCFLNLDSCGFDFAIAQWPFFAFVFSALLSVVVLQSTFGAGPLTISQPAIEISTPVVSILIGIFFLGETISTTPAALTMEIIGILVMAGGIVLMGGSQRLEHGRT